MLKKINIIERRYQIVKFPIRLEQVDVGSIA